MKKFANIMKSLLMHINLIISIVLLTLFITDRFNRAMAFVDNEYTKWIVIVFCITVSIQSIIQIVSSCKKVN